jgi:hypothetical protein
LKVGHQNPLGIRMLSLACYYTRMKRKSFSDLLIHMTASHLKVMERRSSKGEPELSAPFSVEATMTDDRAWNNAEHAIPHDVVGDWLFRLAKVQREE